LMRIVTKPAWLSQRYRQQLASIDVNAASLCH
jgi:hypothetical protein